MFNINIIKALIKVELQRNNIYTEHIETYLH